MCGQVFESNDFFLQSGVVEALRLVERLGYSKGSFVVDIGSGLGRLAIGMLLELGDAEYLGLDANREFVAWCEQNISRRQPSYRFLHVDVVNELYNPNGAVGGNCVELPIDSGSADIVYLWGLFTNMGPEDVSHYISEISRITRKDGKVFLTVFVEDDTIEVVVNPKNYVPYECDRPLSVVKYSKEFLFPLFGRHGLRIQEFRHHGGMFPKQSEIYLQRL